VLEPAQRCLDARTSPKGGIGPVEGLPPIERDAQERLVIKDV